MTNLLLFFLKLRFLSLERSFSHFFLVDDSVLPGTLYIVFSIRLSFLKDFFSFFVTLVGREKKISVAIESRCFILVALIKGVIHTFYFSFQC